MAIGTPKMSPIFKTRVKIALSILGLLAGTVFVPKLLSSLVYNLVGILGTIFSVGFGTFVCFSLSKEWVAGGAFVSGYIKEAVNRVETEREFTEAERDAFQTFGDEVRSMPVQSSNALSNTESPVLATTNGDPQNLSNVRERYRETVMDVEGYEKVYDEKFPAHLAAEFGDGLTSVVLTEDELTQPIQTLLVKQASTAAAERDKHLDALETEYGSIIEANSELRKASSVLTHFDKHNLEQHSFEELVRDKQRLDRATESCQQVLQNRQNEIHDLRRRSVSRADTVLQEYLYQPLDVSFPVLSTALDQIHTLNNKQQKVVGSITQRY